MDEKRIRCRQPCRQDHHARLRGQRHGHRRRSREGPRLGHHQLWGQRRPLEGQPRSWWHRASLCHPEIQFVMSDCEQLRGTRLGGPRAGMLHDAESQCPGDADQRREIGVRGTTQDRVPLFLGRLYQNGLRVREPQGSCSAFWKLYRACTTQRAAAKLQKPQSAETRTWKLSRSRQRSLRQLPHRCQRCLKCRHQQQPQHRPLRSQATLRPRRRLQSRHVGLRRLGTGLQA